MVSVLQDRRIGRRAARDNGLDVWVNSAEVRERFLASHTITDDQVQDNYIKRALTFVRLLVERDDFLTMRSILHFMAHATEHSAGAVPDNDLIIHDEHATHRCSLCVNSPLSVPPESRPESPII